MAAKLPLVVNAAGNQQELAAEDSLLARGGVETDYNKPVISSANPASSRGHVMARDVVSTNIESGVGAIVLVGPSTLTQVMAQLSIRIMRDNVSTSIITLQGQYLSTYTWGNLRKIVHGTEDIQIRLGRTADNRPCVVIGTVAIAWSHTHVSLSELLVSYRTDAQLKAWCRGWTASLVTDLSSYVLTGNLSVNVQTGRYALAERWTTPRFITLSGEVAGSHAAGWSGTADLAIPTTIPNQTTNPRDTTNGRFLKVGDHDIGKMDVEYWPSTSLLTVLQNGPTREVVVSSEHFTAVGAPADASGPDILVVKWTRSVGGEGDLVARSMLKSRVWRKTYRLGVWSGWVPVCVTDGSQWQDLRPYLQSPFIWRTSREGTNHYPQYRINGDRVECRGVVTYNVTNGAPPDGAMLQMPVGLRPFRTCSGVVSFDCLTTGLLNPVYFGYGTYTAQQTGSVIMRAPGSPSRMSDGTFNLEGMHWYLS